MMEREDIVALGEQTLRSVIEAAPEDARRVLVRATSGTSRSGPILIATGYADEGPEDMCASGRFTSALSCSGSMSAKLAITLIVRQTPEGRDMRVLQLSVQDLTEDLSRLVAEYEPDMLYGASSFVARAVARTDESALASVRRVMYAGEYLSASTEELVRERVPKADQVELYLAHEAGGYVAVRLCPHLPRNHFHPADGVTIDIDAPDERGAGDVLVTKEISQAVRLVRYRIGDVGILHEKHCRCGATQVLQLLGRKGTDYIKIAGATLRHEEVARVMRPYDRLVRDYRVDAEEVRDGGRILGRITLTLLPHGRAYTPALLREIGDGVAKNLYLTPTKTLFDLAQDGAFLPLTVAASEQPFEEGHKEVKMRFRQS